MKTARICKHTLVTAFAACILAEGSYGELLDPAVVDPSFEIAGTADSPGVAVAVAGRGWFETLGWNGNSTWAEFVTGDAGAGVPDGSKWGALGTGGGGRFYQKIGTVDVGTTYTISGVAGRRNNTDFNQLMIELWAASGFSGAVGTDIKNNATYIGGATLSEVSLFGDTDNVAATAPFSINITVTTNDGDDLWLSFSDVLTPGGGIQGSDTDLQLIDSISVTVDTTPPTNTVLDPTNGAVNVAINKDFVISFSENVAEGEGDILIRRVVGNTIFETIDVTSSAVTISTTNVTINPTSNLEFGTNYWVEITNGVIQDLGGNTFTGITNSSDWAFTTLSAVGQVAIQSGEASNISNVTARINATLACPGTNATVIAYWWETGSGTTNSFANAPYSNITSSNVSHTATGLSPQTSYSFTFRATNATDDVWGDSTNTFTTHDVPEVGNGAGPVLRWQALTGWTAVTLNGEIVATNGVPLTNVRIYFGDNNPGAETADGWDVTNAFPSVTEVGTFSTNLTDLDYETTYYYTVQASNVYGSAWSSVTNISTPRQLWIPTNLAAEAWYDAADETTIALSSGQVSQWDDVSGKGKHATQGTPANGPSTGGDIGGFNALSFDGSNDRLDTLLGQLTTCTIFVVAEPLAKGNNKASLILAAATAWDGGGLYWETESYSGSTPLNNVRYGGSAVPGSQRSYNGQVNVNPSVFQKGIFAHWGSGFTTQNKYYKIGNRFDNWNDGHYKGTIGEIIIIPSALSEDDRQKVEGYLAHKWGLEGELPLAHPYISNPPYASDRDSTVFRFR